MALNTNAHAAVCSFPFYSKRICCNETTGMGGICGLAGDICPGTGPSNCCQPQGTPIQTPDPQYCSYGENEQLTEGHCCPTGQYWREDLGQCFPAEICYPELCPYTVEQPELYFNTEGCTQDAGEYWEACCNSFQYRQQDYLFHTIIHKI